MTITYKFKYIDFRDLLSFIKSKNLYLNTIFLGKPCLDFNITTNVNCSYNSI